MKKTILAIAILCIMITANAKKMNTILSPAEQRQLIQPAEQRWSTRDVAKSDFQLIMERNWTDQAFNPNGSQFRINRSWEHWTENQKKDILLRLYEQGLLTEDDVVYWQIPRPNQIPQARFELIGG